MCYRIDGKRARMSRTDEATRPSPTRKKNTHKPITSQINLATQKKKKTNLQREEDLVVHDPRKVRPDVPQARHPTQRPQRGPHGGDRARSKPDVPPRRRRRRRDSRHRGAVAGWEGFGGEHAAQAAHDLVYKKWPRIG